MVLVTTTSGATGYSNVVRGNCSLVSGTWLTTGVTSGEIVTGGSKVLAYGISNSVGARDPRVKPNTSDGSTASLGSIGIAACTASDGGDWWAIVQNTGI